MQKYFTMDFSKQWPKSHQDFWKVSGPITAAFMLLTFYIVMFKKHTSGEWKPGDERTIVKWLHKHAGFIWILIKMVKWIWV
jgi:hypothetical protein